MVGGIKRWNARAPGSVLSLLIEDSQGSLQLSVRRIDKSREFPIVELSWSSEDSPELSLGAALERAGHVPLPPYMRRADRIEDRDRYQTVYARSSGSVAAPTAGLHIDSNLMADLKAAGHRIEELVLHVGAGTFLPIKSERSDGHTMHEEWLEVSRQTIERLISTSFEQTLAVGTTALRSLESLYWFGARELLEPGHKGVLNQEFPYSCAIQPSKEEALGALIRRMELEGLESWSAPTGLFLLPGVKFHCAGQLLTNFHQPKSSLLFLVEAYIGEAWREVYHHALNSDYRFLSYGDACLFKAKHNE
jgi:S-adenosylmethionine:tRNA ribosyltransferase-isomerase